ncbi:MAG TPA: glycoside hydrolase family 104 protein [Gaiellaceae bacterium]|nr:glycoside hydrolase family 104 protein [Gaiellaceae bacterium]
MARITAARAGGIPRLALLDTIALCEFGSAMLRESDDGYDLIVGSLPGHLHRITSYADHPQIFVDLPKYGVTSSAAGRYQFLAKTWDGLVRQYAFPDFSPESQDLGAIALVRERGALTLLDTGRVELAIQACHGVWASLPGATYGQQVRSMAFCMAAYQAALDHYTGKLGQPANAPDFSNVIAGVDSTAPAWTHDDWKPQIAA